MTLIIIARNGNQKISIQPTQKTNIIILMTTPTKDLPQLTQDDISSMKTSSKILLYDGLVLDVTNFCHPGGPQLFKDNNGQDVTKKFDFVEHSHNAKRMIVHHTVGRLGTKEEADASIHKLIGTENQKKHEQLLKKLDLTAPIMPQVSKMSYEQVCIFINFPKFVKDGQELKMYQNPVVDAIERNPFWRNMVLCALTALFLGYTAISNMHSYQDVGYSVLGFTVGLVVWSMLEYYFHRFQYHKQQHIPPEKRGSDFKFNITAHGIHHAFPNFPTIIVISYYVIVVYLVGMHFIFTRLFTVSTAYSIMLGALVGETWYDILHYFFHFGWQPTWKPIVRLKQNHLVHHYRNPARGFGVSNLFWDGVFGTLHTKKNL